MAGILNPQLNSFHGTAVLFALAREAKPFVGLYAKNHPFTRTSSGGWLAADVALLIELIGVGKTSAREKVEALLASGCRPERIIVAGFAGALREGFVAGDVMVAADIVDETGGNWQTAWPARRWGRVLTCDHIVGDTIQKRQLGHEHRANVVDMESAAVAQICTQHGIPLSCVRVISDDVHAEFSPRLIKLIETGKVSTGSLLKQVLLGPGIISELMTLAKHTRIAAERLARTLAELLEPAAQARE